VKSAINAGIGASGTVTIAITALTVLRYPVNIAAKRGQWPALSNHLRFWIYDLRFLSINPKSNEPPIVNYAQSGGKLSRNSKIEILTNTISLATRPEMNFPG
jgi:hypothetical protein